MRPGDGERFSRLLFQLALRTYPPGFRTRFGDSMEETFFARQRDLARGGRRLARALHLLRTLVDLVVSGLAERVRPSYRPERTPSAREGKKTMTTTMKGWMDRLGLDAKFAARSLLRRPGFAAVAVLTLALGVGANTAMFSVVNGVLLRPLPYPGSEDLVAVWVAPDEPGDGRGNMSYPDIRDLAASASLETLIGHSTTTVALTGTGNPEIVDVGRVTDGLLATFRLSPVLGRDIRADEFGPDGPRVAVIGHGFWRERFGGAPDVLGRSLELGGESYEVVGVAPAGFGFPGGVELWIPRRLDPEGCGRGCHTFEAVGRLAAGSTLEGAGTELSGIASRLSDAFPESNFEKDFLVLSLKDELVGDVRAGLWILLGAVGIVLLIACANVANLLLVRASARTGEVAVRAALGASRPRLAVQILVESGVLAVLGGAAGLGLAVAGVGLFRGISPGTIPRIDQVSVDGPVLLFTLGVVILVTLLFGLSPAVRLARAPVVENLTHAGRGGSTGGRGRFHGFLLGSEVALSVVLLVGAGLLLRSMAGLYAVDPGFDTRQAVRFGVSLPEVRYDSLPEIRTFYRVLEERLAALPGVEAVGSVYGAPMAWGNICGEVVVEGRSAPARGAETYACVRSATPGYLSTMRIPVLEGRGLEPSDGEDAIPVGVVNEAFVRENFPGADVLGERIHITADHGYGSPYWTVVGVVADVRSRGLRREPRPEIYVPHAQYGPGFLTVTVRTAGDAGALVPAIRDVVRSLDPDLPLSGLETLEEVIRREVAPTRFYLLLLALFAGVAVVLAAVGLYGVGAYLASRRTREIGLRVALGARRQQIMGMVVARNLRPALLGMAAGLAGAWLGARLLEAILFGVEPTDPFIFAATVGVVALVVSAASAVPAWRAARVDPSDALREP